MSVPKGPRVLVIFAEPLNLDLYTMILKGGGFEPLPMPLTLSGIEPLPDEAPDLVLLDHDLNLAGSVLQTARQLRHAYSEMPIFLLSPLLGAPPEINPYITGTVQKGNPKRMLEELNRHYSQQIPRAE